jgi:hypothetical protein
MPLRIRCRAVACFASLVIAAPLLAQSDEGRKAVESITESDVRRRIGVIADDSMGGRDTPSKGLDATAAYIAGEFKRFGLKPGGDDSTFIQRYAINKTRLDAEKAYAVLSARDTTVRLSPTRDLVYVLGPRGPQPVEGRIALFSGPLGPGAVRTADLAGKILLVAPDLRKPDNQALNEILTAAFQRRAAAVLVISNVDSALFAKQVSNQFRQRIVVGTKPAQPTVVAMVHERALGAVLAAAGISLAGIRAAPAATVRDVDRFSASVRFPDVDHSGDFAPNVVGIVGTNPSAKGDSIWNGADDDASGTAGVIELAEAFARAGARTRRSLIFLTVSGEEKGLWGSDYFTGNPPVPIKQVVADLNIDMIGRNWKDTIVVIGREHSDLGTTLHQVTRAHPELGMAAIDDPWPQESFYFRSDHYNFARRGVPVLFFFNGTHKDYHQASDSPEKIDAEKEARILRLIYYIGQSVANSPDRPKWKDESFKRIVEKQYQ